MSEFIERLAAALEGRYEIERELGEGGMATVYLARDLRHERKVALKVLRPELAAVVGAERFLAEIKTTANLQHPHILPLFDSGEADSFLFYVMPYVEGESLRDRLDRERQLPVDEAVEIAAKVAGALDSAHKQGVVHRDIKPANILLSDGEPLVADFGIALAVQHAGGGRLTETGLSLGTPFYMSPEQATADRDPGPTSDVYSLGCVLYEMLVGEPPFTGPSAQAVVAKLITADAPEVTDGRKTVPAHVAAATRIALHKLPADRFTSAGDFAAALRDPAKLPASTMPRGSSPGALAAGGGAGGIVPAWLPWSAAVLGLGAALFFGLKRPEPARPSSTRFTLGLPDADGVRAVTGSYGHIAISPDGREIVFQGAREGRTRLYRRSLDELSVQPLPGTEDARYPAFSPDGSAIAFATAEGVYRLRLDGGEPSRVATPADIPLGITWVPDGTLLFGMLAYNMDWPGLSEVSLEGGGEVRKVTNPKSMDHWAYALQDGTHALFTDYDVQGGGLGLIDLEDDSTKILEVDGAPLRVGRWVVGVSDDVLLYLDREGRIMAAPWDPDGLRVLGAPVPVPGIPDGVGNAAMSREGTLAMTRGASAYQIAIVDEGGTVERLVATDSVEWAMPRFAPDGERLLVGGPLGGGDEETWVVDLASGVPTQLSMGFAPAVTEWTSDGSAVLATALRQFEEQHRGLWSRPVDARTEAKRVIASFGRAEQDEDDSEPRYRQVFALDAHPDGVTLALTVDVGANPTQRRWDIYTARLDGDTTLVPFAVGNADELAARFSPDGRWLAYASNESGRFQVYVRPFPGPGPRVQVSAEGGGQPVWSPDGHRVFYRTDDALMAADLVLANGQLRVERRGRLFQGTLLGGPDEPDAYYDVHPDGHRFAVLRGVGHGAGDVVVWKDWLDEIRPLLRDER